MRRISLPDNAIHKFRDEAVRARARARAAFDQWEREVAELATDDAKRKHTPTELLNKRLEAQRRAVETIREARGDVDAAKREASRLARLLAPDNVLANWRFTPTTGGGTAEQIAINLIGEREHRAMRREQIASMSADDLRGVLSDAVDRARAEGVENSDALAEVYEVERRIRANPIPGAPTLGSAVISAKRELFDHFAPHALLLEDLREAGEARDEVEELHASARQGQRTTRASMQLNPFIEAARKAAG